MISGLVYRHTRSFVHSQWSRQGTTSLSTFAVFWCSQTSFLLSVLSKLDNHGVTLLMLSQDVGVFVGIDGVFSLSPHLIIVDIFFPFSLRFVLT